MKLLARYFLLLSLVSIVLAGCVPMAAEPPVEPTAGSWPTWVVTDVAALRPAAPPAADVTQAELKEVEAVVAARDDAALAQIAY